MFRDNYEKEKRFVNIFCEFQTRCNKTKRKLSEKIICSYDFLLLGLRLLNAKFILPT